MVSVVERNNHFYVVYYCYDENGMKKQKWESYKNALQAKERKNHIEQQRFYNIKFTKASVI